MDFVCCRWIASCLRVWSWSWNLHVPCSSPWILDMLAGPNCPITWRWVRIFGPKLCVSIIQHFRPPTRRHPFIHWMSSLRSFTHCDVSCMFCFRPCFDRLLWWCPTMLWLPRYRSFLSASLMRRFCRRRLWPHLSYLQSSLVHRYEWS